MPLALAKRSLLVLHTRSRGSETSVVRGRSSRSAQSDANVSERPDLRALYDAHIAFVWRNLRRLGVPETQLDDAAQEVFLVVHRRWDSFDPARSAPRTFLFGIVLHVAQNERRSLQRRNARISAGVRSAEIEQVAGDGAAPDELLEKREAARLLERVLEELPEPERAVFLLVDVELMSVPEAAEALQLNLNTAYSRVRVARASFARALARLRAVEARGPTRERSKQEHTP
jgi:RNA polymerase sigma-70 factor (ECF subfamily)